MPKIKLITGEHVLAINQRICAAGGNPFHCYGVGKMESALHAAFYPGEPPFQHGGDCDGSGSTLFLHRASACLR